MLFSLEGQWEARLDDGTAARLAIPGTLDEGGMGGSDAGANQWHAEDHPDLDPNAPILTRLTRRHAYEGEARLSRRLDYAPRPGERVFLEIERARCLRVLIDGAEAEPFAPPTLSAPQVFELTGRLRPGSELTVLSDNRYPGLPRADIVYASAATDETQTNWNGLLGYVRLRTEREVFLHGLRVYPEADGLRIRFSISAARPYLGAVRLSSAALKAGQTVEIDVPAGEHECAAGPFAVAEDIREWDEYEGNLYELTAAPEGLDSRTVRFGVRYFGDDGAGRLALNGRRIFLRGEANCAVFPETGHPPMAGAEWLEILQTYRSYGVNTVRFHSWCPPEAAFAAADELGMLMQPELSHWNPRDAFESEESRRYYRAELEQILRACANHPSFVMLTLGNELAAGAEGHRFMDALLRLARETDGTRLYACGSNVHYGATGCDPMSDFYTSSNYYDDMLRGVSSGTEADDGALAGHVNRRYPSAKQSYAAAMARLREACNKPVFGFEVGQYEVLPDFDELADFRGVTDPANLRAIQSRVRDRGLEPEWKRRVEASGELALLCYREEVEAVLRTPEMSGLSLLGLQDFPGQGTALVGMLNSHLRPKPFDFARPERFRAFFRDQLPLVLLDRYAYTAGEALRAEVRVANYGKTALPGPVRWQLEGEGFRREDALETACFPAGGVTTAGWLEVPLEGIDRPTRLCLRVDAGGAVNEYPLWVYPDREAARPAGIVVARTLSEALPALERGGRVFLSPEATPEALPGSVPAMFSTDFWSVGTFPCQSGTMGQLIDAEHPIFRGFPTQAHTDWQWWPMATGRAVVLPRNMKAIVAKMDSYATLRPMAQLFECRVGAGRLLFSSMGLLESTRYPEARALLRAVYDYMASSAFEPTQALTPEELSGLAR